MGYLICAENYCRKNSVNSFRKGNYSNNNAVSNVINYITRNTEKLQLRKNELYAWGGLGVLLYSPRTAINCFLVVQNNANIQARGGKRMAHYFFKMVNMSGEDEGMLIADLLGRESIIQLAYECSEIFYKRGYQVVFAIHHDNEKKTHIHFAINSISFVNGLKFSLDRNEMEMIQSEMNSITQKYFQMIQLINDKENNKAVLGVYFDKVC